MELQGRMYYLPEMGVEFPHIAMFSRLLIVQNTINR